MEYDERHLLFARLMADPQTIAALIDHLPEPEAVTLLKVWREAQFGPAPNSAPDSGSGGEDRTPDQSTPR